MKPEGKSSRAHWDATTEVPRVEVHPPETQMLCVDCLSIGVQDPQLVHDCVYNTLSVMVHNIDVLYTYIYIYIQYTILFFTVYDGTFIYNTGASYSR